MPLMAQSEIYKRGGRWLVIEFGTCLPDIYERDTRKPGHNLHELPDKLLAGTGTFFHTEYASTLFTAPGAEPNGSLQFFANRDIALAAFHKYGGRVEGAQGEVTGESEGESKAGPPKKPTYKEIRAECVREYDRTRNAICVVLSAALNEEASARPHSTYEEKKELSRWINAELRQFGLALKCDRTDRPCLLMGNPGGRPGIGRFVFEYTDDTGKRHHPLTSVELPGLMLMPDDLTRSSYGERKADRAR